MPGDIAFDAAGNLYVVEHGSYGYRIRVFDPQGKLLRTVGHAGPRKAGRWDPEVFGRIIDIDVDREGKLWVVEDEYWPKRVALFAADGTFEREFLGNTPYGGAGVLDPFDKRRMFVGPLEFELDWKTGHSRLKNLSWAGSTPPVNCRSISTTGSTSPPGWPASRCPAASSIATWTIIWSWRRRWARR